MNAKEEMMSKLVLSLTPGVYEYIGTVAYRKMTRDRIFKIELSINAFTSRYTCLEVTILSKAIPGHIDQRKFHFHDYLVKCPESQYGDEFIISPGNWDWYIMKPTDQSIMNMNICIEDYFQVFEC